MSELEDAIRDGGKVILGGNANTAKTVAASQGSKRIVENAQVRSSEDLHKFVERYEADQKEQAKENRVNRWLTVDRFCLYGRGHHRDCQMKSRTIRMIRATRVTSCIQIVAIRILVVVLGVQSRLRLGFLLLFMWFTSLCAPRSCGKIRKQEGGEQNGGSQP